MAKELELGGGADELDNEDELIELLLGATLDELELGAKELELGGGMDELELRTEELEIATRLGL